MHLREQRPLIPVDSYVSHHVMLCMVVYQLCVSQEASSWDVLLPETAQDIDQEFALRYGIEPIYRIMTYAEHPVVYTL